MPIYVYRCTQCQSETEIFAKMEEIDDLRLCKCGTEMGRQFTAPNINGGTLSTSTFEKYRRAFGSSVDTWSSVTDMDNHIKKKNEEFGLNIEPLGNN